RCGTEGGTPMPRILLTGLLAAVLLVTGALAVTAHPGTPSWRNAVDIESHGAGAHQNFNTDAMEGCPFISKDGLTFFIASNRVDGGEGGLDIWVSTRSSKHAAWSAPVNPGPPLNSPQN